MKGRDRLGICFDQSLDKCAKAERLGRGSKLSGALKFSKQRTGSEIPSYSNLQ